MKLKDRIYLNFARLLPPIYRKHLRQQIIYAGEKVEVNSYLGSATILALLGLTVSLLVPFFLGKAFSYKYLVFGLLAFLIIQAIAYFVIYFKAEDRTKRVEEVLPDALQLIASDVRAGMTPYQALKLAARKEFGPLAEEIHYVTSLALGTDSFAEALLKITKRIKSETLDRAMKLFTTAMRSGGHFAKLLEELAKDIETTRSLKRELLTSAKTYIAFIMFSIVIGTPLLLAISIQFIDVLTTMQAKSGAGAGTAAFGMGFLAGDIVITVDFLLKVSIAVLIVTSILASILMGVISEGKPRSGVKYVPLLIAGTLIIFAVFRVVIGNFFGGLI